MVFCSFICHRSLISLILFGFGTVSNLIPVVLEPVDCYSTLKGTLAHYGMPPAVTVVGRSELRQVPSSRMSASEGKAEQYSARHKHLLMTQLGHSLLFLNNYPKCITLLTHTFAFIETVCIIPCERTTQSYGRTSLYESFGFNEINQ